MKTHNFPFTSAQEHGHMEGLLTPAIGISSAI